MSPSSRFDVFAQMVARAAIVVTCVLVSASSLLVLFVYPRIRTETTALEARIECEEAELFRVYAPKDRQTPATIVHAYDFYNDCMKRFPGTVYRARAQAQAIAGAATLFRGAPE